MSVLSMAYASPPSPFEWTRAMLLAGRLFQSNQRVLCKWPASNKATEEVHPRHEWQPSPAQTPYQTRTRTERQKAIRDCWRVLAHDTELSIPSTPSSKTSACVCARVHVQQLLTTSAMRQ